MAKVVDPQNWKSVTGNRWIRSNFMKALEFRAPEWIPCSMSIYQSVWARYREKLKAIAVRHPFIFGSAIKFRRSYGTPIEEQTAHQSWMDNWGVRWETAKAGIGGIAVSHPLADWNALATYQFPDPRKFKDSGKRNWWAEKWGLRIGKKFGALTSGSGEKLFDRLYALRGFDNLLRDIASNNPHLPELIQQLTAQKLYIVQKYVEIGCDMVYFHTDIGMQDRLMISPAKFRQYIKPMYSALFQPLRKAGIHVYLSSDGHLLEIIDDLVECGVSVHDPQYRANGLEGIAKHYKGKMCIDLDLDRQAFPFSSPAQLKKQIKDAVDLLASPEGGLMMKAEISDPNTPLENIEAICEAYEEYCIPRR